MAIYKLGEILKSKPIYGAGLKALKTGKYKYFRQSDLNNIPSKYVNETQGKIMNKGDFFIFRAGTIETYYHNTYEEFVFAGYLVKYPINKKIAISKYVYYWSKGIGAKQIKAFSNSGSTMLKLNPPIAMSLKINLPNLRTQWQIIDIIEPLEILLLIFNKIINKVKKILIMKYELCQNNLITIDKLCILKNQKRNDQWFYYDTSAINEFKINIEKRKNILNNIPSRANLSPIKKSFLISKLLGENKIYFILSDNKNVFSTGFLNLTTKCIDHMSGFLLSNDFKKQKNYLSTGTTMIGLNNKNFKKILIKSSKNKNDLFTITISKLTYLSNKLNKIKIKILKILVK